MAGRRQCDQCGSVLPNRMHRQRNEKGQLVCDSCAQNPQPDWPVLSTMNEHMKAEYQRRAAEALASISRVEAQNTVKCGTCKGFGWLPLKGGKRQKCMVCNGSGYVEKKQKQSVASQVVWESFPFYYGQGTGYRALYLNDQTGYEVIPTNGRAGWYDVFHDGIFVGESFPSLEKAKEWVEEGFSKTGKIQTTAHDSGDEALIHHCPFCFGGKVRYWTKEGLKSFAETAGTKQWVLTSEGGNRVGGYWVEAEIKDFGVQDLLRVTLRNGADTLAFDATADHIWLVKTKPLMTKEEHPATIDIEVPTTDLVPGHTLSQVYEDGKDYPAYINESDVGWRVVSVDHTGRSERVYCAEVPETHSFALEGNIWTHNCGSGAVTGGSDGSVDCAYCKNVFTVQVQPKHPFAPQTIDGQSSPPPGMPAGQETEISGPDDLAIEDTEEQPPVGEDPSAAIPPEETPPPEEKNPVPPQFKKSTRVAGRMIPCPECAVREYGADDEPLPPKKGPGCFFCKGRGEVDADRKLPSIWSNPTVQDILDYKQSALRPDSRYFTETGDVLDLERYVDHLALRQADDRLTTLASVRKSREGTP